MRQITDDEWIEEFKPTSASPLQWEDVVNVDFNYVWTLIECDDDPDEKPICVTAPGIHRVNNIGYFVTQLPHSFEDLEVLDT